MCEIYINIFKISYNLSFLIFKFTCKLSYKFFPYFRSNNTVRVMTDYRRIFPSLHNVTSSDFFRFSLSAKISFA